MTAVIYARYSSDNQREESIEGQIRECTAYAEKNDITIVKHYIDRAISAKTDNRPQFQQMIKDSDKKLFDIVLVWKLDRFARNRYDSARYKTQLKKNGVKLMSATEIISEGPEGIILESVLEGYAEYYSADLAEKVVRGQTENILKGRCNGGRGTFGYTLDSERKFHIDPLASPFVLESFTKYRDGLTMKEIRDWLNENGIKNPVGGAFTYNSVEHMLKNRRYIGELKFRDVVVPDAIPPIVPLELFDDVQEKIAKNKKAPARRKAEDDYLLTTKLHCGCCGALMFGESGTSRTGEVHRYYKCATVKKKKGCKKKTVRKQWLEDLVVNQTMQLVKDDAAMESIIAKVMELQNKENTNKLWNTDIELGKYTKNKVSILFIDGIIDNKLKDYIIDKLNNIDIDNVTDSGTLKHLIEKETKTIFPTIMTTERPDKVVSSLLNGRLVIIIDNCPFALILPVFLNDYFLSQDDKDFKTYSGTFIRVLRYIAFIITIMTPGIYIALTTFDQEMIPLDLLTSFASQRSTVP